MFLKLTELRQSVAGVNDKIHGHWWFSRTEIQLHYKWTEADMTDLNFLAGFGEVFH